MKGNAAPGDERYVHRADGTRPLVTTASNAKRCGKGARQIVELAKDPAFGNVANDPRIRNRERAVDGRGTMTYTMTATAKDQITARDAARREIPDYSECHDRADRNDGNRA